MILIIDFGSQHNQLINLFGVCLGAQIILEKSEENQTTFPGLIPGKTKRVPAPIHPEKSGPRA